MAPLSMAHKTEGGMEFIKFQRGIIFSLGTTGTTQMTADSGKTSLCLLQTLKPRQGLSVSHSQDLLGCDVSAGTEYFLKI